MGVRRLGRYELVAELGCGGMATVWLARAEGPAGFERLVAIKRIHPHLLRDPRVVEMFADEARIAASIRHPNVCPVFDFGEADGAFYLVMDFLEGEPWSRLLDVLHERTADVDPVERHAFIAKIVADAAEGLHAAHEARGPDGAPLEVVHRDVAPANLFLGWDGVVSVMDFGCARAADRIFQSELGETRGHAGYVAPEVLEGRVPDRRADVWSLGVVLWELSTGLRLFRRSSVHETLFAVARREVPLPSRLDETVPPELEEAAMRALEADPDRRHATAGELAATLRDFVRTSGVPMDGAEVARWAQRLFPEGRRRSEALLRRARSVRPAAEVAPPVEAMPTRLRGVLRALEARPILAAMAIGLTVGLAGTSALLALEGPRVSEIEASAGGGLPGAPQVVRVPELPDGEPATNGDDATSPPDDPDKPADPAPSAKCDLP